MVPLVRASGGDIHLEVLKFRCVRMRISLKSKIVDVGIPKVGC